MSSTPQAGPSWCAGSGSPGITSASTSASSPTRRPMGTPHPHGPTPEARLRRGDRAGALVPQVTLDLGGEVITGRELLFAGAPELQQDRTDVVRELLPAEVRLGAVEHQEVAPRRAAPVELERGPHEARQCAVDHVERGTS